MFAEMFWKNAIEHKFQIQVSATVSNKVIINTLLLGHLFQAWSFKNVAKKTLKIVIIR